MTTSSNRINSIILDGSQKDSKELHDDIQKCFGVDVQAQSMEKTKEIIESKSKKYWTKKYLTLVITNMSQSIITLINSIGLVSRNNDHFTLHIFYAIICASALAFTIKAIHVKELESGKFIITGFFLIQFYYFLTNCQFDNLQSFLIDGDNTVFINYLMSFLMIENIVILLYSIKMSVRERIVAIYGNILMIYIADLLGISEDSQDGMMQDKTTLGILYFILGLLLIFNNRENLKEKIEKEFSKKLYQQYEGAKMIENLQESILIKSENKIDSFNSNFLILFREIIETNINQFEFEVFDYNFQPTFIDRIKQSTFGIKQKKDEQRQVQNERFKKNMDKFFDLKLLKQFGEQQGQSSNKRLFDTSLGLKGQDLLSIHQLLQMEKSEVGIQIFQVIQKEETKYVQLKITDFIGFNDQKRTMIQMIDITGNILHDQQKRQNEFLSMINACVSHDLRNPLNSIKAMNLEKKYIYKLIDESLENENIKVQDLIKNLKIAMKKLKENVSVQESSCNFMHFTIQDLLDYAQIKADKFRKNIKKFNVVDTVKKVMAMQQKQADQKFVHLCYELDNIKSTDDPLSEEQIGEQSPMIYSDEQRIIQVLIGLQSNALKFTQRGEVKNFVTIYTEQNPSSNKMDKYLKIKVMDTGIGIEQKDQNKLFKLFGFIQSSQGMNQNGIGLGLVISDKIVKKFGGEMSFESVPNEGSVFTFTFKLEDENDYKDDEEQSYKKSFKFRWKPKQTLLNQEVEYIQKLKQCKRMDNSNWTLNQLQSHIPINSRQIGSIPPADEQDSQDVTITAILHKEQDLTLDQKRVLIVDDQIFNIDALNIILGMVIKVDVDSICDRAFSGDEALKMVIENVDQNEDNFCNYSLILMDCNMPFMDGYEATDKIRQHLFNKGILQPIIIGITGHTENIYIQRALDSGMNEVLFKPCESEELSQIVNIIQLKQQDEGQGQNRLEGLLMPDELDVTVQQDQICLQSFLQSGIESMDTQKLSEKLFA